MAARDFEDILQVSDLVTRFLTIIYIIIISLQCAIPVFTGLLPQPQDRQVSKLLFILAHWHGLAKLRMHTDDTIQLLQRVTRELGNELQIFRETCTTFVTKELRREAESHRRREARAPTAPPKNSTPATNGRRPKVLNLNTYKLHALGDYASQIKLFGTTDSFSTQLVGVRFSKRKE